MLLKKPTAFAGGASIKAREKRFVFNATPTKRKPIKLIEMEYRFVGRIALCESGGLILYNEALFLIIS